MSNARASAREIIGRASLLCAAVVLSLFISDAALRALGFRPTILDPRMFVAHADTLLPYTLRPHYTAVYAGGHVSIDADGFRAVRPRLSRAVASDSPRVILLVGDSQIFGAGLDDDQTIPSQLQDSLYARRLNARVTNIGVPGYSSWNEYRALAQYLDAHRVDEVVLLYHPTDATFDNNFPRIDAWEPYAGLRRAVRFLYRHIYTIAFLRQSWLQIRRRPQTPWSDMAPPSDSAINYSMIAVQHAADFCRAHGVRFSVGLYRHVDALFAPRSYYPFEARLQNALAARGLSWFLVASHTTHLTARQIMVSWADRHAGARASAFIVSDILRALKL